MLLSENNISSQSLSQNEQEKKKIIYYMTKYLHFVKKQNKRKENFTFIYLNQTYNNTEQPGR